MRREASRNRLSEIVCLLGAAAALLAAPAAFAAKAQVCVDPNKTKCFPTIQEGIDAAEAGQLISIAKGEYFENVVIGKASLRLEGSGTGNTVLRGDPNTAVMQIDNSNVEIRKMTIRGGAFASGAPATLEITAGSSSAVLENIEVLAMVGGACILSSANQTLIRNSTIGSCGAACIATGIGVALKATEIRKSEIGPCGGPAINAGVIGAGRVDDMIVDKNEIFGAGGNCISIKGSRTTITRNDVELCGGIGIRNNGDFALIENNNVESVFDAGIQQECGGGCSVGSISKNEVEEAAGPGIAVTGGGDGALTLVLEKNSVENSSGSAYDLEGGAIVARRNSAKRVGANSTTHCFDIEGDGNLLESNTGDRCTGNGYNINGDENNLNKNKATRNVRNGFLVANQTLDNVLNENTAQDNGIYGFEIFGLEELASGAENTVLNEDKAKGNQRADLCNAGVNTTINGGKYKVIEENRNETFFDSCFQW